MVTVQLKFRHYYEFVFLRYLKMFKPKSMLAFVKSMKGTSSSSNNFFSLKDFVSLRNLLDRSLI